MHEKATFTETTKFKEETSADVAAHRMIKRNRSRDPDGQSFLSSMYAKMKCKALRHNRRSNISGRNLGKSVRLHFKPL